MSNSSLIRSTDRRRFIKLVGVAGLSSAVGSAMTAWAEPRPNSAAKKAADARKTAAAAAAAKKAEAIAAPARVDSAGAAPKPPEISEEARTLASIVQRRYGQHLDAKQLEAVTLEIENRLQGGKRLREAKLANADEPDFTFRA